jgi:hypothetical protein
MTEQEYIPTCNCDWFLEWRLGFGDSPDTDGNSDPFAGIDQNGQVGQFIMPSTTYSGRMGNGQPGGGLNSPNGQLGPPQGEPNSGGQIPTDPWGGYSSENNDPWSNFSRGNNPDPGVEDPLGGFNTRSDFLDWLSTLVISINTTDSGLGSTLEDGECEPDCDGVIKDCGGALTFKVTVEAGDNAPPDATGQTEPILSDPVEENPSGNEKTSTHTMLGCGVSSYGFMRIRTPSNKVITDSGGNSLTLMLKSGCNLCEDNN